MNDTGTPDTHDIAIKLTSYRKKQESVWTSSFKHFLLFTEA